MKRNSGLLQIPLSLFWSGFSLIGKKKRLNTCNLDSFTEGDVDMDMDIYYKYVYMCLEGAGKSDKITFFKSWTLKILNSNIKSDKNVIF